MKSCQDVFQEKDYKKYAESFVSLKISTNFASHFSRNVEWKCG